MGQILPLQYLPQDLCNYVCKENELKMPVLLYDTSNGGFSWIKKRLAHVMLRGVKDFFFTDGYSEEYAKIFIALNRLCQMLLSMHHLKVIWDMHHRDNI